MHDSSQDMGFLEGRAPFFPGPSLLLHLWVSACCRYRGPGALSKPLAVQFENMRWKLPLTLMWPLALVDEQTSPSPDSWPIPPQTKGLFKTCSLNPCPRGGWDTEWRGE